MEIQVTVAVIGVVAAFLGSAIGVISSYFSTRSMRKFEWKLSQIDREIDKKESLYADFLSHANLGMISSVKKEPDPTTTIKPLMDLDARIHLVSPDVGELARKIVNCVIDHHRKDKEDKASYPPLRDEFILRCRASLDSLRGDA